MSELSLDHVPNMLRRLADVIEAMQKDEEIAWLEWSGGQYPDLSPGDVVAAYADGTIVLDDGMTTWNPLRASAFLAVALEHAIENLPDNRKED